MKTSLAIALAVAALTIGTATISANFEHRRRGRGRTRQVVRGGRVPTEADTVRNASWAVSRDRHASRSLNRRAGWQSFDYGGPRCGD